MPCVIDYNKVIVTPIHRIIDMLQQQLYVSHINKLSHVQYKSMNARITCPIHKGGLENTPSCDILLQDRESVGSNGEKIVIPAGTVHCFSCGYNASLVRFISDCLNISYRKSVDWLLGFVDYEILEEQRDIGDNIFKEKHIYNNYNDLPIITNDVLKEFDYFHPYMYQRKLTDDIIEKFEVGYYPKEEVLTFPVYVNGQCLFVAKRKVKYKKFIMPKVEPKPIYGLDYVENEKEVYITESIINALTLWSYGLKAIALFGTGSKYQIDMLNNVNIRKYILCLDGDEAGINGRNRLIRGLKDKIVTYIEVPKDKDINDLTKEEFFSLEEKI
ncbi:MAG: toprim domain-containing protein [Methanobrevibacter sp.]|nr:toprim domain-containing protein [Methanobrevibacter sp.]